MAEDVVISKAVEQVETLEKKDRHRVWFMGRDYPFPERVKARDLDRWFDHIFGCVPFDESCDCDLEDTGLRPVIVVARGSSPKQFRNLPTQTQVVFETCLEADLVPIALVASTEKGGIPTDQRPGLRSAMRLVKAAGVRGLAMHHMDRLSRDVRRGFSILEDLANRRKSVFIPTTLGSLPVREISLNSTGGYLDALNAMSDSNRDNYTRAYKSQEAIEYRRSKGVWPYRHTEGILFESRQATVNDGISKALYTQKGKFPLLLQARPERKETARTLVAKLLAASPEELVELVEATAEKWACPVADLVAELSHHRMYGDNGSVRSSKAPRIERIAIISEADWRKLRDVLRSGFPARDPVKASRSYHDELLTNVGAAGLVVLDQEELRFPCPHCGSDNLQLRSAKITTIPKMQDLWRCLSCTKDFRTPYDEEFQRKYAKSARCDYCWHSGALEWNQWKAEDGTTRFMRKCCNRCGCTFAAKRASTHWQPSLDLRPYRLPDEGELEEDPDDD